MSTKYTTAEQRIAAFWAKVDKSGGEDSCWNWMAYANEQGYGRFRWRGSLHRAHRVSYEIANGRFPDGLDVLHSCDNPRCVNPKHLFLGTDLENARDRERKGRSNTIRGMKNAMCKLTDAQVAEIRLRYENGETSHVALAAIYSVSRRHIWNIVKRKFRI